jgi:hypothetical protein
MNVSFGGMRGHPRGGYYPPPPPCPMFGLGGSKRHLLGHGNILGGPGFGGVGWFDDDLEYLDEGRVFHMNIWPLEAQHLPQEPRHLASYAKMSFQGGMTSSFRAFFFVNLNSNL